eukprot:TRINITY_DN7437_c0_g1_i9.p2 TRINITY_DN7437_c0_g1~~TRINITY_DN7437_c0_g1_i9.p2  ORF type:complete len:100 (+),score=2.96 TRINITY_DN7437_c0_g1_i9:339-638(+)
MFNFLVSQLTNDACQQQQQQLPWQLLLRQQGPSLDQQQLLGYIQEQGPFLDPLPLLGFSQDSRQPPRVSFQEQSPPFCQLQVCHNIHTSSSTSHLREAP